MLKKNKILYCLIGVLLLFSVVYFAIVINASHAFEITSSNDMYAIKLELIEKAASKYGNDNKDLFKEKESIYITVDDLVTSNYLLSEDSDGNVYEPGTNKIINTLKIRVTKTEDSFESKIIK